MPANGMSNIGSGGSVFMKYLSSFFISFGMDSRPFCKGYVVTKRINDYISTDYVIVVMDPIYD